jgi:MFS family permease
MGWAFDTMDQWLFVFVKEHAIRDLLGGSGVPQEEVLKYAGWVQSCMLVGWATGGLIFGIIGDRLGRTRTMAITILMYAGFTGLSGLAQNWQQFAVLRFLMGLGVGGEFAAGAALVAETFPDHSRAIALGIVQAASAFGNIAAAGVNLGMASILPPEQAWRWVFAIGILPGLLVFVIILFVKEPDKWVAANAEAKRLRAAGVKQRNQLLSLFTERGVRKSTLVGVGLATIGVIGFWGISTWTPELLRSILDEGLSPVLRERYVSLAGMAQNLGGFFGALCFAAVANRFGRRPAFAIALIGCSIVIPATFVFTTSFMLALAFFFSMGFVLLFFLGGFAVYFPELFPTRLRATGTGFCYNVARYLSAAFPAFFGMIAAGVGIQKAALLLSSFFILGLAIVYIAPETKGKPLPE